MQETRAETLKPQPASKEGICRSSLEVVSQCELHDSRCSLNTCEVTERHTRAAKLRIETVGVVSVTSEMLRVGNVKGFPTNGELV